MTAEDEPKLLDFGIAKLLDPEPLRQTASTATELRLMTPDYASPEQARGDPITTASDIYSLGVLLYELLTGHRPYRLQSRPPHEMIRVICQQVPEKPSTTISRVEEVTTPSGITRITPELVSQNRHSQPDKLRRRSFC